VTGLGPDAKGAMYDIPVAYVPENLRLGNGIETFCHEKRRVIGASDPAFGKQVEDLLAPLHPIGDPPKVIHTNLQTAEMIKHATNAFLATSISLANELAMIASRHGIDAYAVGEAMKAEPRIGRGAYVMPGMGFAGGTLPRDLRALQAAAALPGCPGDPPIVSTTPLMDSVLDVNARVYAEIVEQILGDGAPPVCRAQDRGVLLLGYSYKADVQTLRRSPAIDLATAGREVGFHLDFVGYDPSMNGYDLSELRPAGIGHLPLWPQTRTSSIATDDTIVTKVLKVRFDTVVVLTARPEFRSLDWSRIEARLVLDCCDGVSADAVLAAGIPYKRLWGPVRTPPAK
jgi:nucleotide sugar dehydrogenase